MSSNTSDSTSSDLPSGLFLFVLLFGFWLLLTGSSDPAEWIAGLLVALVVTLISRPHLSIFNGLRLTPMAIPSFFAYLGVFTLALIRANLDMARRVLSPSLPLQPALVEVRTELRSPLGRLILANTITLTPGTLTVDVVDDIITIHWVDCPPGMDIETATRSITREFEKHLKGFVK
ncbi:MAG: Na+/H+ antiporter subunit E [Candidatus Thiodiazotropha sp.]